MKVLLLDKVHNAVYKLISARQSQWLLSFMAIGGQFTLFASKCTQKEKCYKCITVCSLCSIVLILIAVTHTQQCHLSLYSFISRKLTLIRKFDSKKDCLFVLFYSTVFWDQGVLGIWNIPLISYIGEEVQGLFPWMFLKILPTIFFTFKCKIPVIKKV